MTNEKPVVYKIYCPYCKNLWILKSPKEVTTPVYNAWTDVVLSEHEFCLKEDKLKWWEKILLNIIEKLVKWILKLR